MRKLIICLCLISANIAFLFAQKDGMSAPMRKMALAEYIINRFYVDNVDENKIVDAAIAAMAKTLDPHSSYMDKEAVKALNEPIQGNFEGIGVQFNMLHDSLYIIQTIAGAPAEKVGVRAGDRIIYVGDTLIAGVKMNTRSIMKLLKGPKGSSVTVKVLRPRVKELIEFKIIRDKIPLYSIDAKYMINKTIGYIKISNFAATTHKELLEALNMLQKKGMKDLVLDLGNNGGGLLGAAINVADEFLTKDQLIVYTEGKHTPRSNALATDKGHFHKGRLVVLVDEFSASASEIVTGAIQDWDRGVVIGRRTFGKGLVQRPFPLPDKTMLKLTVARYYTPSGRCVQKPFNDQKEYAMDLINRYNRGEMIHADSIHFPDSLKRMTLKNKRVVYGGGGIMPDIFIPLDTTRINKFHRNIIAKNCLNAFTLTYTSKHKAELQKEYPTFKRFEQNFVITDEMLQTLIKQAKEEGITPEKGEIEKASPLLKLQIKGLIARDLWDMNEYYQIMDQVDDSFKKAVEILSDGKQYDKLLLNNKK